MGPSVFISLDFVIFLRFISLDFVIFWRFISLSELKIF